MRRIRFSWHFIIIVILGLLGGGLAIFASSNGPWGFTDPVVYLSTARNVLKGLGFGYYEAGAQYIYSTFYPPFLSLLLTIAGMIHADLIADLRWINILALFASIVLAGWMFIRYSRVPALGILASAMLCIFPAMISLFSSTYSEPMFILLILISAFCLLEYQKNRKRGWLIAGAALTALIPLTRYAGLVFPLAFIVTDFLFRPGRIWKRLWKAILTAGLISLPTLAWFGWVYAVTGHSIGGRAMTADFATLGDRFQQFRALFMDTVWRWLPFQTMQSSISYGMRYALLSLGVLLVAVVSFFAWRSLKKTGQADFASNGLSMLIFFGMGTILYLGFIVLSFLFTTPAIDVDDRMLLPFYVTWVMTLFSAIAFWSCAWLNRRLVWLRRLAWVAVILCVYWFYPSTMDRMNFLHEGFGYTSNPWKNSPIVQAVNRLPDDTRIVANDWEALLLWTGKPIYSFWNSLVTSPLQTVVYGENTQNPIQAIFCQQNSVLVITKDIEDQAAARMDEVDQARFPLLFNNLPVLEKYPDGTLYRCR